MTFVSVIIPTYNRAEFLEDAVHSVLNQTHTELECIVVDGGSTDHTRAVLDSIDDVRLHPILRDHPRGISSARNAGLESASGDCIVFLDDDDRLETKAVQVLLDTVSGQPSTCGGAYAAQRRAYESGNSRDHTVPDGRVEHYEDARIRGPSCTLVRNDVIDDIGGFDETLPAREDVDFWIRLFNSYHLIGVNRVLYERRDHNNQLSKDTDKMATGTELLIEKHGDTLSNRKIASFYHDLAHDYAQKGLRRTARTYLRKAIQTEPTAIDNHYYHFWLHFGSAGYRVGRAIPSMYRELHP